MDSEIRRDGVTGRMVIVAPHRGGRPYDYARDHHERPVRAHYEEQCPFCPGNEEELARRVFDLPDGEETNWRARVVRNKYPSLTPETPGERRREGIHTVIGGHGLHEVIIETPRHDLDLARMEQPDMETVVQTYLRCFNEIGRDHPDLVPIIFKNHGKRAGTSLIHSHSQLAATPFAPRVIHQAETEMRRRHDVDGHCAMCSALEQERAHGRRIVHASEDFLVFVPFAASSPYELWCVPRVHQASFGEMDDAQARAFAAALRVALEIIWEKLDDPDYNFVIASPPAHKAGEPHLHWRLEIRPRTTTPAGFEMGSGVPINPSLPEADADYLASRTMG
jgi:UDPglucose--hexose-1-phosphate uridylyltransferase